MKLLHGQKYRCKVSLGLFKRVASNSQVADKFTDVGFTSVAVTGSGGTRYAEGVWCGADTDADLPDEVSDVVPC